MTEREELRHFIMENIPPVFEDLGWEHTDAQKYAKTLIDHYGAGVTSGASVSSLTTSFKISECSK